MQKEAILTYIKETGEDYVVKNKAGKRVTFSKDRGEKDTLPMASRLPIFQRPFYSLIVATIGLVFGGMLTLVATIIALYYLYFLWRDESLPRAYRRRVLSFLYLAGLLLALGIPLTALSVMHLIY